MPHSACYGEFSAHLWGIQALSSIAEEVWPDLMQQSHQAALYHSNA